MDAWSVFLRSIEEIRLERIRGASWAAWRAAAALLDLFTAVDPGERVFEAAELVREANPSMASLYNVSLIVEKAYTRGGARRVVEVLREFLDYRARAAERIKDLGLRVLEPGSRIATISYSSMVANILVAAAGSINRVYVSESLPGGEGVLLARRLRESGIKALLVPDSAMHVFLEDVDLVMIGADTVTLEPCIVNKVGTHSLLLAASESRVNAVAVHEAYKIHPDKPCSDIELVSTVYKEGDLETQVPLFDKTPGKLLTAHITEQGVVKPDSAELKSAHRRFLDELLH